MAYMCVDFTDLSVACPKDPYPLLEIDRLINESSGYYMLLFMDAYLGYNQTQMDPLSAPKTTFMSKHGNYYNVMTYNLKNDGATYQ